MSVFPVGFSGENQYEIEESLRFRSAASAYLTKTPPSVGTSRRRFTWSGWIKRGSVAQATSMFGTSDSGAASGYGTTYLGFLATGVLRFVTSRISDGQTFIFFDTTAVFLDPSAHYHVVVSIDIDQAVAANGCRIWVNNKLQAGTFNFYLQSNDMFTNHTVPQYVGRTGSISPSGYVDGFMSEIHMIDGQSLTPSSFGEADGKGMWQPKKYTGTYGINGYYLPFPHATTVAELGFDCKPNSHREVPLNSIVGASLSTADFPFGTSSILVNGAYGSYVLYNVDSRHNLGSGQFSLKIWVKDIGKVAPPSLNANNTIISQGDNAGNAFWRLSIDNTTRQLYWGFTGGAVVVSATYPVSAGVWHEIVVTRDASNFERIFLDGRLISYRSNVTTYGSVSGLYVHLGASYDTNYPGVYGVDARHSVLNGYLKDLAVAVGYIPEMYQTSQTVVGTQVWTTQPNPTVTDAKLNKGWGYTTYYVPAEGTNGSTTIPEIQNQNWTVNNISLTAGVTYDWTRDTPTDNSPVINNRTFIGGGAGLLQDANLSWREATGVSNWKTRLASMAIPTTGKWYTEFAVTYSGSQPYNSVSVGCMVGLHDGSPTATFAGQTATTYGYGSTGVRYNNATGVAYGGAWPTNCVVMVAYDASAGQVWFGLNGVWTGGGDPALGTSPAYSSISGEKFFALGGNWISPDGTLWVYPNFGKHRALSYTPPTGFQTLSSRNLPEPAVQYGKLHFDAYTYVGDGTNARTLTFPTFDPDFIWFKQRTTDVSHYVNDRVRGNDKILITNLTIVEPALTGYMSFGAIGTKQVQVSYNGSGGIDFGYNQNAQNYVTWLWKGGNVTVANSVGSITTQTSVNPTGGLCVATWTGNDTAGATIGHGLGTVPRFIIIKARTQTTNWTVYHGSLPNTQYLLLSQLNTAATAPVWNNTTPNTTVVTLGGAGQGVNNTGIQYVGYIFSEIPGYSKFGSYTGNGSADGTFVYCGFQPRYLMFKRTDATSGWTIVDTQRNPQNNSLMAYVNAESLVAEVAGMVVDVLGNGFKWRSTAQYNVSGGTYIFAAFAEHPFKYARAF